VPLEELKVPGQFPQEVVFYFGSQTGTAEKFCNTLDQEIVSIFEKDGRKRSAKVIDFEEFKEETFAKHPLVIVCASTHYEGDPCDNMKKFYRWLRDTRKSKDEDKKSLFKGLRFVVFGLGDSSYEQFNAMGKFINEGLE
jgi:NADPH-ferrihemoprotein reductase